MLTSQGWQPGSSLGASDAAHAAHYTAASESHIRVLLKDDNLGLGAKRGSERAENFGLAGLESILGRLNGKEEDVKKEEERMEKVEQRAFVYRKYGMMNFVSGGFLVGDKIKTRDDIKKEPEVKIEVKTEPQSDDAAEDSTTKKRKRRDREVAAIAEGEDDQPKLKRKKKSMNLRDEARKETLAESIKPKKDRKEKKDKERKKSSKDKNFATSDPEPMTSDAPSPASDPEPLTDKAKRKADKKARKEGKKLKKALKRAAKEAAKSTAEDSSSESEDDTSTPTTSPPTSVLPSGTSTPTISAAGLTFSGRGMHAVRQRYIRQKRAATMDAQAMKEIFMIKSTS